MSALALTGFQARLVKVIEETPRAGRFACFNALDHLSRAWHHRREDPEIAVFRAITAEEEAATAIFHGLKIRGYKNARRLNRRNHQHKAAVEPFLNAVHQAFAEADFRILKPAVAIRKTPQGGRLALKLHAVHPTLGPVVIEPMPPLHGVLTVNGESPDFGGQLQALVTRAKARSISAYVNKLANERNRMLYAGDDGVPKVIGLQDWFFFQVRDRIFRNFVVYLMIVQERSKQDFVQQALDAFLRLLDMLPNSRSVALGE